jgi:hypothetical protein
MVQQHVATQVAGRLLLVGSSAPGFVISSFQGQVSVISSVVTGSAASSEVFSLVDTITATESMRASRLVGAFNLAATDGNLVAGSTLVSASCAVNSRLLAGYPFGSSSTLNRFAVECPDDAGGNAVGITDFRDDVSRGVIDLETSFVGSYPRPMVDGPQMVNQPALKRGVILRIFGDDLEDGPLLPSAGYWTDSSAVRIGDGPVLTLPTTLAVGTKTFTAHVVDADGLDSDIPWPVEVLNDSARADNWMWPDRDRWRVAALRFDQLPPKTNATDVGTFVWRCFTPGCTTTCAFDPDPNADIASVANAPCRSPVEVAGLSSGSHTFVVQPRDADGAAIDLPQRYTWRVGTTHPARDVRLSVSADGASEITMTSQDSTTQVVTCSVDGRHEIPCRSGLSISGLGASGQEAQELVIRVRARATGQEIFSPRTVHLNDLDDIDGDGWTDSQDPCLTGAEIAAACLPPP